MRCDRFDDLVASNALLRPGPLDAGMHTVFIRRKLGQEAVSYPHPSLKEILEPTYGVITYQEQVMRIANVLAGFSLAEADVLRKAVGKKDSELIRKELGRFVERAVALGIGQKLAADVAAQIETFGRYGFNKSHSVAYSVLSYQTAWLKTHHPAEFMAALLSSEIGSTDKVVQYINEARELGLEVLPPDVNESGFKFTVVGKSGSGSGWAPSGTSAGERSTRSSRAARRSGSATWATWWTASISGSATSGCWSRWWPRGPATRWGDIGASSPRRWTRAGRGPAQAAGAGVGPGVALRRGPRGRAANRDAARRARLARGDRLVREKEVIGFFISGHPLEPFRPEVELFGTRTTATLHEWSEHQVTVAVVVTAVKRQISKKSGKEYARIVLEDFHGTAEAIVFPESWARLNQVIVDDAAVLLTGGYSARDRGEDRVPFVVETARPLAELRRSGQMGIALRWAAPGAPEPALLRSAAAVCAGHPGPAPVYIDWSDGNGEAVRLRARGMKVEPVDDVVQSLRSLLGADAVRYVKVG
jgi:DNA polymerase-3 subunit alpha